MDRPIFDLGWEKDRPKPPLISLAQTELLQDFHELAEGDTLVLPSADRLFYLGDLCEDGAWGGDVMTADMQILLSWEWLTVEDMISAGFRVFKRTLH